MAAMLSSEQQSGGGDDSGNGSAEGGEGCKLVILKHGRKAFKLEFPSTQVSISAMQLKQKLAFKILPGIAVRHMRLIWKGKELFGDTDEVKLGRKSTKLMLLFSGEFIFLFGS